MSDQQCVVEKRRLTWRSARQELLSIAASGRGVYFRGQANVTWPLKSSFGRLIEQLTKQGIWAGQDPVKAAAKLEKNLWAEFRKAYGRLTGVPPLPNSYDEDFIALGQHYSLPTRFLDWSTSPYIAAFFAFQGDKNTVFPPGHKVAIWAIEWETFKLLLYYNHWKKTPKRGFLDKPPDLEDTLHVIRQKNRPRIDLVQIKGNSNRRIIYQEGLFTSVIRVADDIEQYLKKRARFSPRTVLTKITIPGSQQAVALRDLSLMGITPVTLMNDPDGAGATAFNTVVRFGPD